MNKQRPNIKSLIWIIPILFLHALISYFNSGLNICFGIFSGMRYMVLLLILFLYSIIFIVLNINKIFTTTKDRINRILICLFVIVVTVIPLQLKFSWKEFWQGERILSASIYSDQFDIGRIELFNSKNYYAVYGHIDWCCGFTGEYRWRADTLMLLGNPYDRSDGILSDRYILTDSSLIPIKNYIVEMERTETMILE